MNEDKVIEQIARPIIEQLKKLDNSEIQKKWNQIPKILESDSKDSFCA